MENTAVHERLAQMRQKYLETDYPLQQLALSDEDKDKLFSIKKKLASLEQERCIQLRNQKDPAQIDQKIAKQKEKFRLFVSQHAQGRTEQ